MERKVSTEQFTMFLEGKADKQMVLNAVINKVGRVEMEQALQGKVDKGEFESRLAMQ